MLRSGNPALRDNVFTQAQAIDGQQGAMTIQGTANKTIILLFIALFTAALVWSNQQIAVLLLVPGLILGFIVAMVTIFKKEWSPVTAPVYALLEGLVLGAISSFFEARYPGIVIQAVALTFGTLFCLLIAYKTRLIKVTENFKLGVISATGAICLLYIVSILMGFFGFNIGFIHSSGPLGIGFCIFVVVIAALNLVIDFDFIEKGSEAGAPKYLEWYSAFALLVTLIWLYLEILRLLSKVRSR